MQSILKKFFNNWVPPALAQVIRGKTAVSWHGDYSSWEDARKLSTGYEHGVILDKVKKASLKVKSGEAVFERDSVIFNEVHYSWPLLAGLMWIAALSKGELNVIDFGGALGSTYFQNRKFLRTLSRVRWNIVEQKHFVDVGKKYFVDVGKKYFEDDELRFHYDIENCLGKFSPNTIIFSGVIPYIERPYALLKKIKSIGFEFILFDRTSFMLEGKDRLTVQEVSPKIYPSSYPCWFFNKEKFFSFFNDDYELIATFNALAGEMKIDKKQSGFDKGMIFKQRK
jgi:putative methyltransferase (TIGR04325 family)